MSGNRIRTTAAIQQRANELRKSPTPAERQLWECLRNRQLGGYKFRRQAPLGPFIADFYCAECRLVIELDGGIHSEQVEYDQQRTQQFIDHGYTVIRFTNDQLTNDLAGILRTILHSCQNEPQS